MTQVDNLEEAQFLIWAAEKNNKELKQERDELYMELALLKRRLSERYPKAIQRCSRTTVMTVTKGGKAI